MDNPERSESSRWISAAVDLLAPPADWEPDLRLARTRFAVRADARIRRRSGRRRHLAAAAMAALLIAIVVPAIPQTRALAQQGANNVWQRLEQAWYWLTIVRRGPVLVGRLPSLAETLHTRQLVQPDGSRAVSSAAEAALAAGFTPRMPDPAVLPAAPQLSVLGPAAFETVLSAADLVKAMRASGVLDPPVPSQWDGARLTLEIGATITAHWPDVSDGQAAWSELTLVQGRAAVTAPPGLDPKAFAAAGLRAAGMRNSDTIGQLAGQATTVPALLFGYRTPYQFVGVRDVALRAGFVTLIEEFGTPDGYPVIERLTLLWSAAERVYLLIGLPKTPLDMHTGDLAAAISSAIAVAYATAPPTGSGGPHRLGPVLHAVPPNNR
jgi:hypothetical protein